MALLHVEAFPVWIWQVFCHKMMAFMAVNKPIQSTKVQLLHILNMHGRITSWKYCITEVIALFSHGRATKGWRCTS